MGNGDATRVIAPARPLGTRRRPIVSMDDVRPSTDSVNRTGHAAPVDDWEAAARAVGRAADPDRQPGGAISAGQAAQSSDEAEPLAAEQLAAEAAHLTELMDDLVRRESALETARQELTEAQRPACALRVAGRGTLGLDELRRRHRHRSAAIDCRGRSADQRAPRAGRTGGGARSGSRRAERGKSRPGAGAAATGRRPSPGAGRAD